ncbi:metal ABC transporter ATP-binding protein [Candidatus Daviesbacteria bacterium]|nr:metal ABC transporter ATP-binding protein [Candidatus Daviesbacteria bacterium]
MQNADHSQNIIEINNVSFAYGSEEVLENINLQIQKGDYLGIVGPNGGGKTTLLKCILGLLKPTKGTIKLLNQDRIGYVPQKVNFDPNFPSTAKEVVGMGMYGKKGLFKPLTGKDWQAAEEALAKVGMQKFAMRRIGDLSGGQQQRVFIARALVSQPEVIFLDEPTVGVDIETRNQFFTLLEVLNKKLALTLVLITHDMDIILHHGVLEVAFMNKKVLFYGRPADLLKTKFIDKHF